MGRFVLQDGNGVLDADEKRLLRQQLARQGVRRGAWARITIDQFRHSALQTF
jgi:hypothetical protein